MSDQTTSGLQVLSKKTGINLSYYFKHGSWFGFQQVFKFIAGLTLSVVFARFLTTEVYGQYQYIIALIGMIGVLSLPDINTSLLRGVARGYEGTYRAGLRLRLWWSLLGVPVMLAIGGYYYYLANQSSLGLAIFILAIFFPLVSTANIWTVYYQAKEEFRRMATYSSIQYISNIIFLVGAVFIGSGKLFPLVLAYLVSVALVNWLYIRGSLKRVADDKEEAGWRPYGYYLAKLNILAIVTGNLDRLLVGTFLGLEQLAIYGVGTKFASNIQEFLASVLQVTTPRIAKSNTLNKKKYLTIFIVVTIFSVLLILILPPIMRLLFTTKYEDSIYLSQIVVAFLPFFVINNIYSKHLKYYLRHRGVLLKTSIISPLSRLALMAFALPLFGLVGMAIVQGGRSLLYIIVQYFSLRGSNDDTNGYIDT